MRPGTEPAESTRRAPGTRASGYSAGWRSMILGESSKREREADATAKRVTRDGHAPSPVTTSESRRLTPRERAYYEPRLGADFSDVTVHGGRGAKDASDTLGAEAFSFGNNVVLGDGAHEGPEALAHELAHIADPPSAPRVERKVKFRAGTEEGASNEALALFKRVGLAPESYTFTSFDGGRALVEARGNRPTSLMAEIVWSYLKASAEYDRQASTLGLEAEERRDLTNIARTVGPKLVWGSVRAHACTVNPTYWMIVAGKDTVIRTKPGVDVVDAINDVETNTSMYSVECYGSVAMLQMIAERHRIGDDEFRRVHPELIIFFQASGVVTTSLEYSGYGEVDIGAEDDEDELIPGDASNWKNSAHNENIIYVGNGQYFAHPKGIVNGKADYEAQMKTSGLALARYRYRWRTWLP